MLRDHRRFEVRAFLMGVSLRPFLSGSARAGRRPRAGGRAAAGRGRHGPARRRGRKGTPPLPCVFPPPFCGEDTAFAFVSPPPFCGEDTAFSFVSPPPFCGEDTAFAVCLSTTFVATTLRLPHVPATFRGEDTACALRFHPPSVAKTLPVPCVFTRLSWRRHRLWPCRSSRSLRKCSLPQHQRDDAALSNLPYTPSLWSRPSQALRAELEAQRQSL